MKDTVTCLQKQDDLCSHYRKWLTAVAECAKALTDSKAAVATAEAEVKVMPLVHAVTQLTDVWYSKTAFAFSIYACLAPGNYLLP